MGRFSINRIFHMDVAPGITNTSQMNMTLFLFTLDAGAAFLSGNIQHPSMTPERGTRTLLYIRRI
jgi:hypothetical protein